MTTEFTVEEICDLLDLAPHPTCGFVRVSYVYPHQLAPGTLPEPLEAARALGSALYFLVAPAAPVRLHRIRSAQLYHYYLGDPLEVIMLQADGRIERVTVGPDLRAGERPQLLIPGNTFHTARVQGAWFLGASTEWPGVEPADVEVGDLAALCAAYPDAADDLRAIASA